MKRMMFCAVLLLVPASAGGQEAQPAGASYRAAMKAQYEAAGPAPRMGSQEAQRIYDAYLGGLGKSEMQKIPENGTEQTAPAAGRGNSSY